MGVNLLEPAIIPAGAGASTAQLEDQSALAKKYGGDWNKANDGYFNAVKELDARGTALKERDTALQQIAQRNQQLESALATLAGGGAGLPDSDDPLAAIQNELGLPIEPLRRGIHSEVEAAVKQLLGPVLTQYAAESELANEIENFDQMKGLARKHMKESPEVSEVFNAVVGSKPAAAWRYAIREALIASGGRPPGATNIQHAGLPGGMAGSAMRTEPTGSIPDATRLKEALDYSQTYGDDAPYRRERFKGTSVERAVLAALQQAGFNLPGGGVPQGW